jgi:hypothetical protein
MKSVDPQLGAPKAHDRDARRVLSTPARMMTWMALPIVCILACWGVLAGDLGGLRDGFQTIGAQSGPNVEASGHLYYDLADMDGQVANILLIGDKTGLSETRDQAFKAYQSDQADADDQLELIGSGIDAIQGGASAYIAIENGLSRYALDVDQAMYIDGQLHGQQPAVPPAVALAEYQQATALMHAPGTGVLPEAHALLVADQNTVDATAGSSFGTIGQLRIWGVVLILLVLLVLLAVQRNLARTFKRRVNPLLALGTILTLIFGVLLLSALGSAHDSYVVQKENSFCTT